MVKLRSLALLLLGFVVLLACTKPRTQIILLIDTDMPQGPMATLTHIRVTVGQPNQPPRQRLTYRLGDGTTPSAAGFYSLPGTLGISALDNDGSRSVEIKVDAVSDPGGPGTSVDAMFSYFAVAPFEEEKTLLLPVFLADRCRTAPPCDPGFTCGRERCERIQRTLTAVPADFRLDASALDAATEAALDAPDDLQPSDATVTDTLDAPATESPLCPIPLIFCDGTCVDPRTSTAHCGACGTRCSTAPNTTVTCAMSRCEHRCVAGFADCDGNPSNGCEVDLQTSTAHCGACGRVCMLPHATAACASGTCTVASCHTGFADCDGNPSNGCEVDLRTSAAHCGRCGNTCNALGGVPSCVSGTCHITCDTRRGNCDGNPSNGCEVDLGSNGAHCGTCGNACPTGEVCSLGACALSCASHLTTCGTACVDRQTHPSHCGACNNACPTRSNATATCTGATCGFVCLENFADCDGNPSNGCEVDLRSNPNHCGACMRRCAAANATALCRENNCQLGTCNPGFADCDGNPGNGCEVDLRTSATHCGGCGRACVLPHATAACTMGACTVASCHTGFADCDGNASNGCEVDLRTSTAHCGACSRACMLPHATAACASGTCAVVSCNPGFADCDGNASNGCEVDLRTSTTHCGGCGQVCSLPNATAACTMGTCTVASCNPGFADCDRNPASGCETNINTSSAHCGACGRPCPAGQRCSEGFCTLMCGAKLTVCDGACVDTATDPAHCGRCNNRCPLSANATTTCSRASCNFTCNPGFADCDGNPSNGCEVDLRTNAAHCGACSRACMLPHATAACSMGACTVASCNPGFADCDRNPSNGCEVDLRTNVAHCGRCGNACPAPPNATATCTGATCGFVCLENFADCDGNPSNGCEVDLRTNVAHCGRCGNACPAPPNAAATCTRAICGFVCEEGFADCDGNPSNGCEVDLRTNVAHCGRCGNACPAPPNATAICRGGTCAFVCHTGFVDCDRNPTTGCELMENAYCDMNSGCIQGGWTCLLGTAVCHPRRWLSCGTVCPSNSFGSCDERNQCVRIPVSCSGDGGITLPDSGPPPLDIGSDPSNDVPTVPFDGGRLF